MTDDRARRRGLGKTIDYFVPPKLRDNDALTQQESIRARVLIGLLIGSIGMLLISLIIMLIAWLISDESFLVPTVLSMLILVVLLSNGLLFYRNGRVDSAAAYFSLTTFIVILGSILLTGGYGSPAMLLLICVPIVAFLIGGRHEGIFNSALVYITATTLLILHAYNVPMMQLISDEVVLYLAGLIWFATTGAVVICLYVYDVLLEETQAAIVYKGLNKSL
jgi:hypothetical protein